MIKLIPAKVNNLVPLENLAKEIWHECYTDLLGESQVEYMIKNFQSNKAFVSQINNGYEYYFLEYDGEVAGYVGLLQEEDKLFLSKLYLKSRFYGRGIAQMLLNVLVDRLKENGLIEMYLTVNKGNLRAIRTYERFGFIRTDSIITDIGNGFVMDDYVYTYRI